MRLLKILILGLATASIVGCAGMSQSQCESANWEAIGYEHGARGLPATSLASRREACAKHGVTADFRAYQRGHEEGLDHYCQPSRGYNEGRRGASYNGACQGRNEDEFVHSYNEGRSLWKLSANVTSAQRELNQANARIEQIEHELTNIATSLIDALNTPEQRTQSLITAKHLRDERASLLASLDGLEYELQRARQALVDQENQMAAR